MISIVYPLFLWYRIWGFYSMMESRSDYTSARNYGSATHLADMGLLYILPVEGR